ncbi:MAG: FtsW/RodA/SpoVE family cell cycle protein, partial [Bdellovibrionales bacterium]
MRSLFLTILFLLGLGLVQIYSSSFIFAIESFDDGLFFVKKQALFVCVAIVLLVATTYIPWKWLEKIGVTLWGIALLGVALTLVPGIGVKVGGASRWLSIGAGFRFEPSELLKYTYPFFLSLLLTNKKYYSFALNLNENREFAYKEIGFNTFYSAPFKNIFFLALPFLPIGLLLVQPDFGSTVII